MAGHSHATTDNVKSDCVRKVLLPFVHPSQTLPVRNSQQGVPVSESAKALAKREETSPAVLYGCSSGRMARTVTVPPVTGVLIRGRKVPETLPAKYSVVAFAGTAIVVHAVQTIAPADPDPGAIGVVCGQHSTVI